ncbi:reprolysin-like metallopeptidase [Hyphobacterium sp.]|uniref:reprolysin-like metallopeptidase n=1 Tax=Hyphobacterium sp. TaxID=2004662 RepID=UPI003749A83C
MLKWIPGLLAAFLVSQSATAQDLLDRAAGAAPDHYMALSDQAFRMQPGERLLLTLPDGGAQEIVFDRSEISATGDRLWVGHLADAGEPWRVILTRGPAATFGYIATPEGAWTLAPETPGGPLILNRDLGAPLEPGSDALHRSVGGIQTPAEAVQHAQIAEALPVGSNGTIDVAITYTQGMQLFYGLGLTTRMQHLVNVLDQALVDSDTGLRARFVGATPMPAAWDEFTSTLESIDDLYAGASYGHPGTERDVGDGSCSGGPTACINNGDLSYLLEFRNAVGADIVVMLRRYWRAQQTYCGVAYVPGFGGEGNIDPAEDWVLGVAVTGDGPDGNGTGRSCGDLTFSHEVGHNLGSTHNIENTTSPGVFNFSYGHRVDCSFRTIMAYDSTRSNVGCVGSFGQNETWLPRFSNPLQGDCLNQACGTLAGFPHAPGSPQDDTTTPTENARSMREAGLNVRDYRPEGQTVRSALLPYSRTVSSGTAATAFVSVVNPASTGSTAEGCGLQVHGASGFTFQRTDPATNAVIGAPGDLADIPAGGVQTFVISLVQPGPFAASDIRIDTSCRNRASAPAINGLNTLLFTSTTLSLPDVIALAATTSNNGIVELPSGGGANAFSVATANLGSVGNVIVSIAPGAEAPAFDLLEICRTNAATGQCETPRATSINQLFNANETLTFAAFVRSNAPVGNVPATNRVFVHFRTPAGQSVGATSVAVRSQ